MSTVSDEQIIQSFEQFYTSFTNDPTQIKKTKSKYSYILDLCTTKGCNFIHHLFKDKDQFNFSLIEWCYSFETKRAAFIKKDDKGQTPLHYFIIDQDEKSKNQFLLVSNFINHIKIKIKWK